MYLRRCLRKSSFSFAVRSLSRTLQRPGSCNSWVSAATKSLEKMTCLRMMEATSSSRMPRDGKYLDRFFRMVVQK